MTEEKKNDTPISESKVIELTGENGIKNKKSINILFIVTLNLIITTASLCIYHCYILKPVKNNQNIVGVDIKAFWKIRKKAW